MKPSVTIVHAGRVIALPSCFGPQFERVCTVTVCTMTKDWYTKRLVKHVEERQLFWYEKDPLQQVDVFCTWSGYLHRIATMLAETHTVQVERRIDTKLGEPDVSLVKDVVWRPHQRDVFVRLLSYDGGVVVCPTGFGKSFLMTQLARVYPSADIVVTVPSVDIARALERSLTSAIGAAQVGFVGDGERTVRRVTVAVTHSIEHTNADASLVLVDECHSVMTKHFLHKLFRFRRAKLFGFTATPRGRHDRADAYLEACFGPIIYEVPYQEAVRAGNVVPLVVRVYTNRDGPSLDHVADPVLIERHGIIANAARNRLIAAIARDAEREFGHDEQILIMVDKVEHAYRLHQLLPDYTVVTGTVPAERIAELREAGVPIPERVDRDASRDAFAARTLKRVIATRVWEKGVDFPDLRVLIRADGLASAIAAAQVPGRLSRIGRQTQKPYGVLIDINDTFCKALQARYYARLRTYRSHGWRVVSRPPPDTLVSPPSEQDGHGS